MRDWIRRERCPKCGASGVRRSESLLRHWSRVLGRSKKRFCPACGERWRHEPPVTRELLKTEELLFVGFLLAGLILLIAATHPRFLKNVIAAQIKSYDDTYEYAQGRQPLWRVFARNFKPDEGENPYPIHLKRKKPN